MTSGNYKYKNKKINKLNDYESLTHKEQMIFNLLIHGFGKREIAETLKLSPTTVHTHIMHIYQKKGYFGYYSLQKMICDHYKVLLKEMGVQNA